jgi:hypothetical protein
MSVQQQVQETREQIEARRQQLEQARQSIPQTTTAQLLGRTGLTGLNQMLYQKQLQKPRKMIQSATGELIDAETGFEQEVAMKAPEYGQAQYTEPLIQQAKTEIQKRIDDLKAKIKSREEYLEKAKTLRNSEGRSEKVDRAEDDISVYNAELNEYQKGIGLSAVDLIKQHFSGYIREKAQYEADVRQSRNEAQNQFNEMKNKPEFKEDLAKLGLAGKSYVSLSDYEKGIKNYNSNIKYLQGLVSWGEKIGFSNLPDYAKQKIGFIDSPPEIKQDEKVLSSPVMSVYDGTPITPIKQNVFQTIGSRVSQFVNKDTNIGQVGREIYQGAMVVGDVLASPIDLLRGQLTNEEDKRIPDLKELSTISGAYTPGADWETIQRQTTPKLFWNEEDLTSGEKFAVNLKKEEFMRPIILEEQIKAKDSFEIANLNNQIKDIQAGVNSGNIEYQDALKKVFELQNKFEVQRNEYVQNIIKSQTDSSTQRFKDIQGEYKLDTKTAGLRLAGAGLVSGVAYQIPIVGKALLVRDIAKSAPQIPSTIGFFMSSDVAREDKIQAGKDIAWFSAGALAGGVIGGQIKYGLTRNPYEFKSVGLRDWKNIKGYDPKIKADVLQYGRKTIVKPSIMQRVFGRESPIYEGIYFKNPSGYAEALKLLMKQGYKEASARNILRFYSPKFYPKTSISFADFKSGRTGLVDNVAFFRSQAKGVQTKYQDPFTGKTLKTTRGDIYLDTRQTLQGENIIRTDSRGIFVENPKLKKVGNTRVYESEVLGLKSKGVFEFIMDEKNIKIDKPLSIEGGMFKGQIVSRARDIGRIGAKQTRINILDLRQGNQRLEVNLFGDAKGFFSKTRLPQSTTSKSQALVKIGKQETQTINIGGRPVDVTASKSDSLILSQSSPEFVKIKGYYKGDNFFDLKRVSSYLRQSKSKKQTLDYGGAKDITYSFEFPETDGGFTIIKPTGNKVVKVVSPESSVDIAGSSITESLKQVAKTQTKTQTTTIPKIDAPRYTGSIYAGTGQYEQTTGGAMVGTMFSPRLGASFLEVSVPSKLLDIRETNSLNLLKINEPQVAFKTDLKLELGFKSALAVDRMVSQRVALKDSLSLSKVSLKDLSKLNLKDMLARRLAQRQSLAQRIALKQNQALKQNLNLPNLKAPSVKPLRPPRPRPIKPIERIVPIPPLPEIEESLNLIKGKKTGTSKDLFFGEVRRGGKWLPVFKGADMGKVLKQTKQRVGESLSASLRLRKASGEVLDLKPKTNQFYKSKREKGVLIEKRKFRLSSPGEKKEINFFKRMKSKPKIKSKK